MIASLIGEIQRIGLPPCNTLDLIMGGANLGVLSARLTSQEIAWRDTTLACGYRAFPTRKSAREIELEYMANSISNSAAMEKIRHCHTIGGAPKHIEGSDRGELLGLQLHV